jgi:hypothetical protein
MSIRTNGKVDAAIMMARGSEASPDEDTMTLLAVIPMSMNPRAVTAAAIGLGSGLTSQTLLGNPRLQKVDTVEIEDGMIEGANNFRPRVESVFSDPRSRIFNDDAKTFFSTYNKKYDLIVSEPSNPWVSGVAGLFSKEFYKRVKDHLNGDGLLVQWLQLYEIDMPLVASVFEALSSQFSDYVVYITDDSDVIVLARPVGAIPGPDPAVLSEKGLSNELRRVRINGLQDVLARRLGNKRALQPLFDSYNTPANSDYYPLLDLYAARALFTRASVKDLTNNPDLQLLPALEMLGHEPESLKSAEVSAALFTRSSKILTANMLSGYIQYGRPWKLDLPDGAGAGALRRYADKVRLEMSDCSGKLSPDDWWDGTFYVIAECILPYSSPHQLALFWQKAESSSCWSRISPSQQDFIRLLKAVDGRDGRMMAQTAGKLLDEMPAVHPVLQRYFLAAGMLGDLSLGRTEDARSFWLRADQGRRGTPPSFLLRFLLAHIDHPPAQEATPSALEQ